MSTRFHRSPALRTLAAAAVIAAAAAGFAPGTASAAEAPNASTAAAQLVTVDPMVSHARAYIGTNQGQCKVFLQKIHAEVYANTLGTGYYQAYINAGYHRVAKADILPGDVVQETNAAHTLGIHTAIISGNPAGVDVKAIDSNFVATNIVGEHTYNPDAHAASHGGTAYYWRK